MLEGRCLVGIAFLHLGGEIVEPYIADILELQGIVIQVCRVYFHYVRPDYVQELRGLAEGYSGAHAALRHLCGVADDGGGAGAAGRVVCGDDLIVQVAQGLEELALALALLADGGDADIVAVEALDAVAHGGDDLVHELKQLHLGGIHVVEYPAILLTQLVVLDIHGLHDERGRASV